MKVSAKTRVYGLIGDPVSHSLSPFIMNRAFRLRGIDSVYVAFRVPAGHFPDALHGLRALGVHGVNVTYPHKEAAVAMIDRPSALVETLGASNTLSLTPEGVLGYNTDAAGAAIALESIGGCSLRGRSALVFGAGGAGRAVAYGVLEAGTAKVTFCVRDPSRTDPALSPLRDRFAGKQVSVITMGNDDLPARKQAVTGSDIIVNATPLGHGDQNGLIEDTTWIEPRHLCFDLVYGPSETWFVKTARERGAAFLTGLALLVAQASEGFLRWTGEGFDLEDMLRAVEEHSAQRAVSRKGS